MPEASDGLEPPFIVVAIDGPAGAGKSTVGKALAQRLGLDYLDTGAMYRGVTFAALRLGVDPSDAEVVANLARNLDLTVASGVVTVDGVDASIEIRGPEVTRAVSAVASNADVRTELVRRQREWARERNGGVLEGRDIGTVVFPDAALKVYLTASPQVRAERRAMEEPGIDVATVAADIARRDAHDSTREASPLAQADDAFMVDTSELSVDDIVDDLIARMAPGSSTSTVRTNAAPDVGDGDPVMSAGTEPVDASGPSPLPPHQVVAARPIDPAVKAAPTASLPRGGDTGRRGHARAATRAELVFYAVVRGLLLGFARVWLRLSVRSTQHVPTEGAFILSPVHRSNLDFLLVLATTKRRLRFLAKDTLWKGFWGRVFTALGGIPVARGAPDREALRTCIEVIEAGEPLVIFPEGTRQQGPVAQPFFDGPAFVQSRTGVAIIPVGIGGSETAMPKGAKFIKPHKVRLVVGEPLRAPEVEGSKARRASVRARTAELHGVIQDLFDAAQAEAGTPNR